MKNLFLILSVLFVICSCSSNEEDALIVKKYKNKYLYEIQIESQSLKTYSSLEDEFLNLETGDSICEDIPVSIKLIEKNDMPVSNEDIRTKATVDYSQAKRTVTRFPIKLDWPIFTRYQPMSRIKGTYYCLVIMISYDVPFGLTQFAEQIDGEYLGFNPYLSTLTFDKSQYSYYNMNNDGTGSLNLKTAIIQPLYAFTDKYQTPIVRENELFPYPTEKTLKLYYVKYDY